MGSKDSSIAGSNKILLDCLYELYTELLKDSGLKDENVKSIYMSGMVTSPYDPYIKELPEEFRDYTTLVSLDEIIKTADFISLHLPLTDETRDMITVKELSKMKEGVYVVNTSRGGIVNEADLYEAVKSGHVAGAALDVSVKEPMDMDNPLRSLENIIITPHIGMYSKEAIGAVSLICAQNAAAKIEGKELQFKVV